jgi:hypothetical protein
MRTTPHTIVAASLALVGLVVAAKGLFTGSGTAAIPTRELSVASELLPPPPDDPAFATRPLIAVYGQGIQQNPFAEAEGGPAVVDGPDIQLPPPPTPPVLLPRLPSLPVR